MKMQPTPRLLIFIACLAGLQEMSFAQNEGDLRLTNGSSIHGLLEIFYNSTWSTISYQYFSYNIYKVACRQLGLPFTEASPVRDKRVFGPAHSDTSVMVLDRFWCNGDELRLIDCPTFSGRLEYNYAHDNDIAVFCKGEFIPMGELRLVEGSDMMRGRLEIYTGNSKNNWMPFCKRGFDTNASVVACRQLGFNTSEDLKPRVSYFSDNLTLNDVLDRYIAHCTGEEMVINSCDQLYLSGLSNDSYEKQCKEYMDVELCCPLASGACTDPMDTSAFIGSIIATVVIFGAICGGCCMFCRGRRKKKFKPPMQYRAVSQTSEGGGPSNQILMNPVGDSDLPVYVHDEAPAITSPLPAPVFQPHADPPSSKPTDMPPPPAGGSTHYSPQPATYPSGQVPPPVGAYPAPYQPGYNPTAVASMQYPPQQPVTYAPQPASPYPHQPVASVAPPYGDPFQPPAPPGL